MVIGFSELPHEVHGKAEERHPAEAFQPDLTQQLSSCGLVNKFPKRMYPHFLKVNGQTFWWGRVHCTLPPICAAG